MRDETPGALDERERALLDGILDSDFVGVVELREQARSVLARKGCTCGCGTIDLVVTNPGAPRSAASRLVPVEGQVLDADGEEIGGLILFVVDGTLSSLEVYSFGDPLPLPDVERVRWVHVPR